MKNLLLFLAVMLSLPMAAQRKMDVLDRGLVAQKVASGVFLSWRITGEEYYDVTYNVYRDGTKLNDKPLTVSNYTDRSGSAESHYTVSAVVRGVELPQCKAVGVWTNGYLDIELQPIVSRRGYPVLHPDFPEPYQPNDISCADLDGDGIAEMLIKRVNEADTYSLFAVDNDSAYCVLEAYKLDGTRLWWIDCGPNMVSGTDVEVNIVAYDWDEDGRAEVLLRGADDMRIHTANGEERIIGTAGVNTRGSVSHTANMTYTNTGAEYLIYMNGLTGEPYQVMEYPLARGNAADWGDAYGHRSTKHFFGAPFLDGRKPSIFLARGIYTQHKMIALDVDPSTHTLTTRWRWNSPMSGEWYGNGYHNFGIADVDWDGRDEICYGSMVIDDNGLGLSTTGLGHGDAQHCSDFDPYRKGQEIFACLEDACGANYRDATTSQIYFRVRATRDDGRCMAGNFTDDVIGSQLESTRTGGSYSSVTDKFIDGQPLANGYTQGIALNFRCYWDGDLLEETFNNTAMDDTGWLYGLNPCISKWGGQAVQAFTGARTCNGTKATPSFMGDILGDWRDEFILRGNDGHHVRLYTTTYPTNYRIYTTWHDHQYRQGMVWQMCGYNQPPHLSYFLGKAEGITIAPPPLMTNGRIEINAGGTINSSMNDQHILIAETQDAQFTVAEGAQPYMLTVNTPSWVQGATDNAAIKYDYYTHALNGAALTGTMRLVKQGDGKLILPAATHTYTGETNVWAGTLTLNGTLENSHIWLNRFASLELDGEAKRGIKADYAAQVMPGGADKAGTLQTDTLFSGFGSRLVIDLFADGTCDLLKTNVWQLERKTWQNGPKYLTPVLEFVQHPAEGESTIKAGTYLIAEVGKVVGTLESLPIEGLSTVNYELTTSDGKVYLSIKDMRTAHGGVTWTGAESSVWDLATTSNWLLDGKPTYFVTGDNIVFTDDAQQFNVTLSQNVAPDTVRFANETKNYTLLGTGAISGDAVLIKEGSGRVSLRNTNTYTGGTIIRGGTLQVAQLADNEHETGNMGAKPTDASKIRIENGGTLYVTSNAAVGYDMTIGSGGGTIQNTGVFTMNGTFRTQGGKQVLTKTGSGELVMEAAGKNLSKIIVKQGILSHGDPATVWGVADHILPADTVELAGGTLQDPDNSYTYSNSRFPIVVREGTKSTWNLDARCDYYNKLLGKGQVSVRTRYARNILYWDLSDFEGTVVLTEGNIPMASGLGIPKGKLNIGTFWVGNNGQRFHIGHVTGAGTLGGLSNGPTAVGTFNTWAVGNDENYSWSGTIGDNSQFEKVGTGKLTMSGASMHSGSTTVKEGQLQLSSTGKLGTGKLTVEAGAKLSGAPSAVQTNSSYTINGTLQVGAYDLAATGKMDLGKKDITFNQGSRLIVGIRNCATATNNGGSSLVGIKKLTMNGTIAPFLSDNHTLQAGDSVRIFVCEDFIGSPVLELPEIGNGLSWDASRISEGLLFVVNNPTGIFCVEANGLKPSVIYTLDGRKQNKVFDQLPSGFYIVNGRKVYKR